jgi:beta-lactamase superfamily II metal-dependent hydrolase
LTSSDRSLTIPPETDQVEVSIFGPGIGECIVLHLGGNKWAIVDSCRDKETGTPIAIRYLKTLQVDPSSSVKLFVVTHWDDDHIRGASEILEMCSNATFSCSCALLTGEFIQFVKVYSERSLMIGSGADEFAKIIQMLVDRAEGTRIHSAGPVWAKANTLLLVMNKKDHRFDVKIRALSPSDGAFTLALNEISQLIPKENVPRRRAVAQKANHVSVALWITAGESHILLGADLENHPNKDVGWRAVVLKHNAEERASIIKVPHHGSQNAYSSEMWEIMGAFDPIALLTPFSSGLQPLPSESDIKRIKKHTSRIYCTGRGLGWHPIRRNSSVERMIRETVRSHRRVSGPMGHVRVRFFPENKAFSPTVETFNSALIL